MKKIIKKAVSMICAVTVMAVSGMPASASSVTDAQKAEYYKEYQEIVQALSEESEMEVKLLPASEFTEEDWRSPEEFEEIVRQLISAEAVLCEDENADGDLLIAERSTVPYAKKKSFTWGESSSCTIEISASFKTQLNAGRQYISSVSSIKSVKTSGNGKWEQIGSDYALIDSSRTAQVAVSGTISYAGVSATKLLTVEFYCDAYGNIS